MAEELRIRSVALFFVKFLGLAPICLVLWWSLLPYYAHGLAITCTAILEHASLEPIHGVNVVAQGKVNTETILAFTLDGRERSIAVGLLATNVAPYVALVLATAGIRLARRLCILALGTGILILGHGVYLLVAFLFAEAISESPDIPTAIAQLFLTLPFLLWIVLAYWDRVVAVFATNEGGDTENVLTRPPATSLLEGTDREKT